MDGRIVEMPPPQHTWKTFLSFLASAGHRTSASGLVALQKKKKEVGNKFISVLRVRVLQSFLGYSQRIQLNADEQEGGG